MTRREKLLQDYLFELVYFLKLKLNGTTTVEHFEKTTDIDTVIAHWQSGVDALSANNEEQVDLDKWDY